MSNPIGQVLLNQFRVESFVAAGGMGAVYRVWDLKRNVPLAMKVLHAELAEDPSIYKRFRREATALRKLAHPNIVPFYGLHRTSEFAFLLEHFVDGPTLKQVLQRRRGNPLTPKEVLPYMKSLTAALGFAHSHDVVHCDVKPGNIMIDHGGTIYLTDFGIARHAESSVTTLGFAGTAAYMAPEQCRAEPVSAETDIYALGVILYEMLTGRRPFRGDEKESEGTGSTAAERIRHAHVHLTPPDPRQFNPSIPRELAKVILKALNKSPSDRYRTSIDLYKEVCSALGVSHEDIPERVRIESEMISKPPTPAYTEPISPAVPSQTLPKSDKFSIPVNVMVIGAIAIVIGGIFTLRFLTDEPSPSANNGNPVAGAEEVIEVTDIPSGQPLDNEDNSTVPQGGTVVVAIAEDPESLNPILASDSSSRTINDMLFLGLVKIDEFSGAVVGEIAESWDVSSNGHVYSFDLRDDIYWTDGIAVTSYDIKFTFDAIKSSEVNSPLVFRFDPVSRITVIDDFLLEVELFSLDCAVLQNLTVGILPSHLYAADFSDIRINSLNEKPTVTNGPFKFERWVQGEYISLLRNDNHYLGSPALDGWIFNINPDSDAELEALLAGEIDILSVSPDEVSTVEEAIEDGQPFELKKVDKDGYAFIGLNLANPLSPEIGWVDLNGNGEFDDGEPPNLRQSQHPILSDRKVRQAIAHSIDYSEIINQVAYGQGIPIAANVLPSIEWAHNLDLEPYDYDMNKAAGLLEQAGWVDTNGDGVREKSGYPLTLSIMTNEDNVTRETIAALAKDNLEAIGFEISLQILEWSAVVSRLLGQEFDLVIIGWIGVGSDPEDSVFWAYRYDDPGGGFNFVSYYNENVESKVFEAKEFPGCSITGRGNLYKEIQAIIHEDTPYIFLYSQLANVVWNTRVEGVNPGNWSTYYNVEDWYISQ